MPRTLPREAPVPAGEEELEDPEVFGARWSKADGEPPDVVKEFRAFVRDAGHHYRKPGVALDTHIPASGRTELMVRAMVDQLDMLKASRC